MIIYISDVFYSFRYAKSSHLCQASRWRKSSSGDLR